MNEHKKKTVEEYWQDKFTEAVNEAMRTYIRESPEDAYKKREFLDTRLMIAKSTVAGALIEYDKYQRNMWQTGMVKR